MPSIHLYAATALVAAAPAPQTATTSPQAAIEAALADSAAAWNAGDADRFMALYADDAIFAAGDTIARGKGEIAAHYAKSFAMGSTERGRLSLQPLAWRPLSAVHMLLVARWMLKPAAGAASEQGVTTLLFERRKAGWRIISDHS